MMQPTGKRRDTFGDIVLAELDKRTLTQKAFARLQGIDYERLRRMTSENSPLEDWEQQRIEMALGLPAGTARRLRQEQVALAAHRTAAVP